MLQEKIVFQPPPVPQASRLPRINFVAPDGQPLFAYLIGGDSSTTGIIIAFHGNADLAEWQVPWAREVTRRTGYTVLLPEYRGYGGLTGRPTYLGTQTDARATYDLARNGLGFPTPRIALFGHSLGSAIAAELAREVSPNALILQSPFTSAREMAATSFSRPLSLIWDWVGRVHYDTQSAIRSLSSPVWVAHGQDDSVVPVAMGERLFATAQRKGELLILPGAGHNDLATSDPVAYWNWLTRALSGTARQPH